MKENFRIATANINTNNKTEWERESAALKTDKYNFLHQWFSLPNGCSPRGTEPVHSASWQSDGFRGSWLKPPGVIALWPSRIALITPPTALHHCPFQFVAADEWTKRSFIVKLTSLNAAGIACRKTLHTKFTPSMTFNFCSFSRYYTVIIRCHVYDVITTLRICDDKRIYEDIKIIVLHVYRRKVKKRRFRRRKKDTRDGSK